MKGKWIIGILAVILMWGVLTAQNAYDVGLIEATLKKDADAVIRLQEEVHDIKTISQAVTRSRLVVTVFNKKGAEEFSCLHLFYGKFIKIRSIDGALYDAKGNKLESLKKADIREYSNFDGANEVTDNRQKYACFDKKTYPFPYTIEFSFTEENNNGMFYPRWSPMEHEHTGIEKSVFSVSVPVGLSFRYKEFNVPGVNILRSEKETSYRWSLSQAMPVTFEEYMVYGQLPCVWTAPGRFEVEGHPGDASTWKGVGKFYAELNANRDQLPEATQALVKKMVQDEPDTLKKIKKIYEYMQSRTRYISIQLGIGGWQAMTASEVDQKGYGDCKALSNYMIALLKTAGIKACPVLIMAGGTSFKTPEDFPCFMFNHAIACVPLQADTLWLECTSQTGAMGYMGSFTGNRKALVIHEEGGALVNTVSYSPEDNSLNRKTDIRVDAAGNAKAGIQTVYRGISHERPAYRMEHLTKEKQLQALTSAINVPRCEVNHVSFAIDKLSIPLVRESIEATFTKLIPEHGAIIFLTPCIMPGPLYIGEAERSSDKPFYLSTEHYTYSASDTVVYHFETDLFPESLPEAVQLSTRFGIYTCSFSFSNNRLLYCRKLILKGGVFPGNVYADWLSFARQVNKYDKLKVAFSRK